ncbi:sugar transferase [Bacillus spongiae]|uniref:Sugar transferase n=1 Tax=Bacillus spongiae TaxID=2683610 RepID=A0ABU8HEC1_9BACI
MTVGIQHRSIYRTFVKRKIDVLLALISIIILSPVFIIVALLVKVKLGSPILFKQKRPGLDEKIFTMYKFRTMTDKRDDEGQLLPDDVRLTKFGQLLRSTSLDELPELFNILNGDMSFVGPRPQLVRDMVFMTEEQRMRHSVLPGLTGWAQVNGRNSVSWEKKLSCDLEYIHKITFNGDVRIILMTVAKVMRKDGINAVGMSTAEDLGDYLLRKKRISEEKYYAGLDESNRMLL